jgi:hypothetical protein
MKFLCVRCDEPMQFCSTEGPHEGSVTVAFACPRCAAQIALLTNPAETQLVQALGVRIGGRTVPAEPLETVSSMLGRQREEALSGEREAEPEWTDAAEARLQRLPPMVRPMARAAISRYARERGLATVTPEVMDACREHLGF